MYIAIRIQDISACKSTKQRSFSITVSMFLDSEQVSKPCSLICPHSIKQLGYDKNIFVMKLPDVRGHHRNNKERERLENISLAFALFFYKGKIPKLGGNEE